jgi:hypothetical protein
LRSVSEQGDEVALGVLRWSGVRMNASERSLAARMRAALVGRGGWGEGHCQVDDPTLAIDTIGDWLEEVLQ